MDSSIWFIVGIVFLVIAAHLVVFKTPAKIIEFWTNKKNGGIHWGIKMFLLVFIAIGLFVFFARTAKGEELKQIDVSSPAAEYTKIESPSADGGKSYEWFAFGEAYIGLDHTSNLSPQCEPGGNNDKWTSHGGFRANIIQTSDQVVAFNVKYTHHSCAFNEDRNLYDGVGAELVLRLW